uniref:Septin-type G domain-containing protein n=1 Tax=Sparus aurata TaxID=8175 RepID=A0A671WC72_SPAAU
QNDIISKSLLVRPGSPAVYQLNPKKEEIGSLRRMTLGEKDQNKTNRAILLVGETGTGKSTLINTLVNYTMGVKWEDDVWFQIVKEEKKRQSESQTSDVIVYQIFGFEGKTLPYSLTIIDTPGYGATKGIERDVIISERLLDWFRSANGVHEIHAVGLVLKATENRLDDRLMYIFDSVVSLFGKDMEQNIVALITHSSGTTYKNALEALEDANIKCAKDENNQPVHFLFDNCQQENRTEDMEEEFQLAFTKTSKGLKKFTDFLRETTPQQLKTTVEVLNERIRLTACIQNLKERIQLTELKQREIQQTQEALKKHEEEMKNDEKFTVEVDEVYKEKQTIRAGWWLGFFYEGATCCTVCEENCHRTGCTIAPNPKSCEVMKDGRCTSCTRKCPVSAHVKENWIYVTKTRKVKKTLQDVKKKYEKEKSDFESLLKNLTKEMEELEKGKDQMLEETFQHVVNLEQIALKVDSVSTHVHLDFLLAKMKEKGDTEKFQKLKAMKRRVEEDKGFIAALQYSFSKLKSFGKTVKGAIPW